MSHALCDVRNSSFLSHLLLLVYYVNDVTEDGIQNVTNDIDIVSHEGDETRVVFAHNGNYTDMSAELLVVEDGAAV